ncbi:NAD(P)-dependent oxidoreductase [Actinomycetospora straminea]|uniref:NAD(P)-dependent oxidoreductase n=1 Tax=Actinomycetospora straminea TaxID=663607 RepID=A0ABP9ER85_9PSEU|nr:NAD(P)-dependent oxidoreductase [Actinomycetospora straminea]MDD7933984.1 NAD(P)-dependent oxidoreductase [Actinomycetospora straminea]
MSSPTISASTVGFVGLGHMGTPMASRLVDAGATVRAYDASPDARAAFAAAVPGATVVDTAADTATGAEAVLLCLPDSDVVEAVVAELDAARVIVDMSSSEPLRTRALAEQLADTGRVLVDAPVSGGVSGARAGTLAVMVGGPDDVVADLEPLLAAMGRPRHVGPVGAGHALKALNNLMSAAHLVASSEAVLVGEEFGLDPAVMLEVVNGSSGRSGSTENKWPNHILPGTYGAGFGLGLMVKDIHIALDLAASTSVPTRHAAATVALWDEALAELGPTADHTEIARWLRAHKEAS